MSFLRSFSLKIGQIARSSLVQTPVNRTLSLSATQNCKQTPVKVESPSPGADSRQNLTVKFNIDRTQIIPVETSIQYLQSEAYQITYGQDPVWVQYRRNHKGQLPPRKTRKTCIRQGIISTGSPCPICRDEYLILDYRNLDLLKQFISPYSGQILSYNKTGLCQKKHQQLIVAIERARDYGLLTFDVPFREYNYAEYYGKDWTTKYSSQQ